MSDIPNPAVVVLQNADRLRADMPALYAERTAEERIHILAAALGGSIADIVWPLPPDSIAGIVSALVVAGARVRHANLQVEIAGCQGQA